MNKVKLTGQLRRLLRVPILLVLFFVVVAIGIFFYQRSGRDACYGGYPGISCGRTDC